MVKQVFKTTGTKSSASFSVSFDAGEVIFEEGDLGTEMYVIQEGEVEIVKELQGEGERQLALLSHGDFFGEMSILEELPRTATARAVSDCKLLAINGTTFDRMLRKNPEIAVRMMRKLSRRLRETDRLLREALGGTEESQAPEMPTPEAQPRAASGVETLVHDPSGMVFHLAAGEETTVGRRDPVTGILPDVDLTPVDSQRSISRRHAKIFRRGDKLYVREEIGTMNGTFVRGERVETGVPVEVKDGDEVRFGLVRTIFHAGTQPA